MTAQVHAANRNEPASDGRLWDLTVLIVDDDPVDSSLCKKYLGMCGAFNAHTVCAESGVDALKLAAGGRFDCVLLDQNLPDISGTDIIDALKAKTNDPTLPVIMLTGQGDESLVVEAMHRGAADYMPKKELGAASLQRSIKNAVEKARLTLMLEHEREVLVEMNHELLCKTREIETFYQTVSHELKTPLTAMREYNSLMLDGVGGPLTDDQREFLTISIECCDRLTGLVNDLFDTARMAANRLSIDKSTVRIDELVKRRVNELTTTARNAGLSIDLDVAGERMQFEVDGARIGQVVSNMLTNAIKFTESGGSISVKLETEPSEFRVSVTDTGRGIPLKDQPYIFDRYYQAGDGNDPKSGMGIGLYLCASIARLHGGEISVDSEPGRGSTFLLRIPARADQPAEVVA